MTKTKAGMPAPLEGDETSATSTEEGQGLAEYALIITFVALACVAALSALGQTLLSSPAWSIP